MFLRHDWWFNLMVSPILHLYPASLRDEDGNYNWIKRDPGALLIVCFFIGLVFDIY